MDKPRWKAARTRAILDMVAIRVAKEIDAEIEKKLYGQFFLTKTTFDGNKLRRQHYDYRAVYIDPMCV